MFGVLSFSLMYITKYVQRMQQHKGRKEEKKEGQADLRRTLLTVLPPSVVDGRSRNPLYYYYYY